MAEVSFGDKKIKKIIISPTVQFGLIDLFWKEKDIELLDLFAFFPLLFWSVQCAPIMCPK